MTTLKADITAADRLLRAAVRKAAETIREGDTVAVVAMLTAAGESAALLYGEASTRRHRGRA